jgi:hypothetical protein
MDARRANPVTRATRRYFIEFGVAIAAYAVVMMVSRKLLHGALLRDAGDAWQIGVAVLPIVPTLFVFIAVVRLLRRTDEFHRQVCVDSLAIAGGVTVLLAITYGLIEGGRVPYLSAWWTYCTFMTAWLIATFFVRRRYR